MTRRKCSTRLARILLASPSFERSNAVPKANLKSLDLVVRHAVTARGRRIVEETVKGVVNRLVDVIHAELGNFPRA